MAASSGGGAPPPPPEPPDFTVVLLRPGALGRRPPDDLPTVHRLIASIPAAPSSSITSPSGAVAGTLTYPRLSTAVATVAFLWRRRLEGSHLLLPFVAGAHQPDVDARLKPLFGAHARRLLAGDGAPAVKRSRARVAEISAGVRKISGQLDRRNSLTVYDKLVSERKQLEVEREEVEKKLDEFRAAMECVIRYVEGSVSGEGGIEVLRFGGEYDWGRLHRVMMRECRRLEMGLPVYGWRRRILKAVSENKVTVLIGETGSGKSTQLVQFLADSGLYAAGAIVCTQPRKIAAISLAERVAEEGEGSYVDNYVVSHPSYSSYLELNSKIIYMTDHCLLQYFMNRKTLAGISCVIVDEAHERSFNTDILLALLKENLHKRSNLRLIIMSATADARKLSDYFDGSYTLHVVGRNFPVDITYIPHISAEMSYASILSHFTHKCASYASDVVKMVTVIHKTEEGGAILAFLTSQIEVEWACENFYDPSAIVLPMHGKLSCEEQKRVFHNYTGKRKVIFSTNIAETSLTIPGVKYVVDSGMVKESRFEPSTGMNVLKVCRISQSSANQRAGRAGRTGPGRCYRLYSECDFQSMQMHQEPEIRKVHLGVAVLRILALGIKRVQDFEFVDAPSLEAIDTATQNLVCLGAVIRKKDTFEFTETGLHLVKLGIEPRLGKIILDSLSCGLGKEGLVLAAVLANASSIFCRVGNDEEKCKADCLKVSFCHRDGDLFTLLSVYKEWEENYKSKSKWCWENSINAKSMRRCEQSVLELENCLQRELNIISPSYWLWNPRKASKHDKSLKKVILSSLSSNVAMHSGYDRLGYEVALTGQHLQLHPSCSLLVFNQKPDWIVFGEILSVSNQYLVCVTSVDYELLYAIQPPLFDISELESQKMKMNVITGLGVNLLRRLCGNVNSNLQYIVSHMKDVCMDNRIGVDVNFDKREIQLFATAKDMEKISCIIHDALKSEAKWLRNECIEKCLYHGGPGSSPSVALLGSGAEIKYLELEKRYFTVELAHPDAHALHDKDLLTVVDCQVPGMANFHKYVVSRKGGVDSNKWGRITFSTPEDAEIAVRKLNRLELHGSFLNVYPVRAGDYGNLPFPAVRARVYWPRRLSKGAALIKCAREDVGFIVNECSGLVIGGRYINCQVSQKVVDSVFVTGLSKDTSEPELRDAFRGATNRRILDIHVLRGDAISDPSFSACKEELVREIVPFMPSKNFSGQNFWVEVLNPEPKDSMIRATITFNGNLHLEAAKALEHIRGKVLPCCLPWQKIECQHMFYSSVSCPAHVYFVIKKELDLLLDSFKHQEGVSCKLQKNDNGSYSVKFSAIATKTIAELRKPVEQLMKGKALTHPSLTATMLQLLLSRDGIVLMRSLERDTRTCIIYDRLNQSVKLFGPEKVVAAAEEKLMQSLLSLHETKQLEIPLRGRGLPPGLMKEVVQRFGADLHGLKERVPGTELILITRHHIISVRGSKEMKQRVEEVITEVAESLGTGRLFKQPLEEATETSCPICLCELEESYKLENCGHDFCRACLVNQVESAMNNNEFPLCCAKEGCSSSMLLVDLRSLLPGDRFEDLFRASVRAFVASSGGAYRFCPTPDCPLVYQVSPPDSKSAMPFVCGVCSAETCTSCNSEYHPFLSCEQYSVFKDDADQSLVEWRRGKENVKNCPFCGFVIEKMDGCNHVTCVCGKHICWVCLESFWGSNECYNHLRQAHQSI